MKPDRGRRLRPDSVLAVLLTLFITLTVPAQTQQAAAKGETQANSPSGATLQPINVKTGLWETTTKTTIEGEMPVSPEMLNRLTPEQRARMEARMKANSAAHSNTRTHKGCLTKEDLEKYKSDFAARNEGCTPTIVSSTSRSAKAKISCDTQGMTGTGTYEVEALDSEHVQGVSHATMTGNGHTMIVDGTFTSKWLGANCGDIK